MGYPEYPFAEFAKDLDTLVDSGELRNGFLPNLGAVRDYMSRRYSSSTEAIYRAQMFLLTNHYLATHIRRFDQSDYAVYGSEKVGALVSEHLLRAIHELMIRQRQQGGEMRDPTPEEVLRLADTFRDNDEVHDA
jgi:hypothetical protein